LFRELAMMKILYHYGGMIVPNSFLCMKNLKPLYDQQTENNQVFVYESINKSVDLIKHTKQPLFSASTYLMGSPKNHESLTDIIAYLENRNARSHFTDEYQFKNDVATYLGHMSEQGKLVVLDGAMIGVKSANGKPIILDQLMEQQPLDLIPNAIGLYIPSNELLVRTKHQWFVALSEEDVLESDCALTKLMLNTLSSSIKPPMVGDINRSVASI